MVHCSQSGKLKETKLTPTLFQQRDSGGDLNHLCNVVIMLLMGKPLDLDVVL